MQNGLFKRTRLSSGKIIQICPPNFETTEVWVKYAPMGWSNIRLERIFSRYGEVRKIEHMTIRAKDTKCKDYIGKRNGIIKLTMKINKNIPCNMYIENARIEIYHRNQVRTCWRCGGGHKREDCETDPEDFTNKFTMEDFPELNTDILVQKQHKDWMKK